MQYSSKIAAALLTSLVLSVSCASNPSDSPVNSSDSSSQEISTDVTATPDPCAGSATPTLVETGTVETGTVEAGTIETGTVETGTVVAQTIRYFVDNSGLAIRGTDPVAYFTQGGPVAGSTEFTHTWNNATWQFATAENRDLFVANPEQYAPQYGGFCAWAVSQGYTASIDPNAWRIVDGKLYLNYNKGVQRQWERDIPGNISQANANWPGILEES
ncbi:YHS domain-containing (seleno)protein [Leptothoe spongobia]|nr:YHS domain-containing (seleno)protein [Leptothoe spongobia]